ncbi:MAG TPA: PilZ domain-containing protein [Vicinamibacteria bacterium]|nr:PilZ domain-containing protein [Vicinamibacteria bacterium]
MAHVSRRRYHRVDAVGRCFAQLGDGWEASVLNLSQGGMLLRLRRILNPGSAYVIKLLFENQLAVVQARVVRVNRGDEDCLAGMEFLSMSEEDAGRVRGYVHR